MTATRSSFGALVALAFLAACDRARQQDEPSEPASVATTPPTNSASAEEALATYLASAVGAFPANSRGRDSLQACPPDGMVDPLYTLAAFRILSSASQGDSALVTAEVTTVVEEGSDPHVDGRRVARVRLAMDTVTWKLTGGDGRAWKVCGIGRGGYDFGHYGTDSNTTWRPPGSTWHQVQAVIDSLRAQ